MIERLCAVAIGGGLLVAGFAYGQHAGLLVIALLVFGLAFDRLVGLIQSFGIGDFTAWQVIVGFLVIDGAFGIGWGWQNVPPLLLCEAAAGLAMTFGSWQRRRK